MPSRVNGLSPTYIAYHSDILLQAEDDASTILHIAITEYLEVALLPFLAVVMTVQTVVLVLIPRQAAMAKVTPSNCHLAFAVESMISATSKLSVAVVSTMSPR